MQKEKMCQHLRRAGLSFSSDSEENNFEIGIMPNIKRPSCSDCFGFGAVVAVNSSTTCLNLSIVRHCLLNNPTKKHATQALLLQLKPRIPQGREDQLSYLHQSSSHLRKVQGPPAQPVEAMLRPGKFLPPTSLKFFRDCSIPTVGWIYRI